MMLCKCCTQYVSKFGKISSGHRTGKSRFSFHSQRKPMPKNAQVLVAQSCPTLFDPMDCSPPGSSVHEIFQARILEWVAISFSRGSFQPRNWTRVSCIVKSQSQECERSVFITIPKKGNAKDCSNYCTIALISHASTCEMSAMHKILQARIQQYVNRELPDV